MWGDGGLRERLGQLARDRRAAPTGARPRGLEESGPRSSGARIHAAGIGIEDLLPGGVMATPRGTVFVHERLRSQIEQRKAPWGALAAPDEEERDLSAVHALGLGCALFLDLETCGLATNPVFLAGTMHWNGSDFVVRQYFARHYGEEACLIEALDRAARGFEYLVTFNGKSYDAPFLASRAVVHGVPLRLPPRHLDLLHASRRRWKGHFCDCRLKTLEAYVCRRRRSGDVPSDEVPALYHDFVRQGDPYRLVPVFHHNMLDVLTMADLLHELCARPSPVEESLDWWWQEA